MGDHEHYWFYVHAVIQGRTGDEVAVLRHCDCGMRQVAFPSAWRKATGDYALDEHYNIPAVGS